MNHPVPLCHLVKERLVHAPVTTAAPARPFVPGWPAALSRRSSPVYRSAFGGAIVDLALSAGTDDLGQYDGRSNDSDPVPECRRSNHVDRRPHGDRPIPGRRKDRVEGTKCVPAVDKRRASDR